LLAITAIKIEPTTSYSGNILAKTKLHLARIHSNSSFDRANAKIR